MLMASSSPKCRQSSHTSRHSPRTPTSWETTLSSAQRLLNGFASSLGSFTAMELLCGYALRDSPTKKARMKASKRRAGVSWKVLFAYSGRGGGPAGRGRRGGGGRGRRGGARL